MSIVNTLSLESNRQIKINFDGGDLSSDAGLLLIKEFVSKLGIDKLFWKQGLPRMYWTICKKKSPIPCRILY